MSPIRLLLSTIALLFATSAPVHAMSHGKNPCAVKTGY